MRRVAAAVLLVLVCTFESGALAGRGADGRFEERSSRHFRLLQDVAIDRYTGVGGTRAFERQVLEVLEHAFRELRDAIDVEPRAKVVVVIWDPEVFDLELGPRFRFRVAGFFDGSIHVRGGTIVDQRLVRTLQHEYVHAALDQLAAGAFPAWLNEGIAELFEARVVGQRRLTPRQRAVLAHAAKSGRWIPVVSLAAPSFTHLAGDAAGLAYLESHALVDHLVSRKDLRKLRDLVALVAKTRNSPHALQRTYRLTLEQLETALLSDLH